MPTRSDKIAALRRLAADPGATVHERELAALLANNLEQKKSESNEFDIAFSSLAQNLREELAQDLFTVFGYGKPGQRDKPYVPAFEVGDVVTRDGTDEHVVVDNDPEGWGNIKVRCIKEPSTPWIKVGEEEDNLPRRYALVRKHKRKLSTGDRRRQAMSGFGNADYLYEEDPKELAEENKK